MTISFPVTLPSYPAPSRVQWTAETVSAVSASPFSLKATTFEYVGGRWRIDVAIDPLTRAEAAPWVAFLVSLRGSVGTFYFGDTLLKNPIGAMAGSPRVAGANQIGYVLNVDGFTALTTFKAGDFIQIDTALYQLTKDGAADGSGLATLDLWPALRDHDDDAVVVTSSTKGVFRLEDQRVVTIDAPQTKLFSIGFSAVEVV